MTNLVPGIQSTTAALNAERTRLDIIAQNIGNAHTTRGIDGKPYQRQQVVFEAVLNEAQGAGRNGVATSGPKVSQIIKDTRPMRTIFEPTHPHADPATGMLSLPNVDIFEEMADLIAAGRTFEANIAVMKTGKQMTMQSLGIGRR
jgi:flagellar basal-body rod protein FlgC